MKVRVQPSGLKPVQEVEGVSSVVIYDDFENPVVVVKKTETGQLLVSSIKDGTNFRKLLKALGIGLNATCTTVHPT